ncbi:MAG: hypothetical protein LBP19_08470 [Treponema sp.]|jgi:hypothetical protein|nr:hypothetical protein [Treponema sp.]
MAGAVGAAVIAIILLVEIVRLAGTLASGELLSKMGLPSSITTLSG